MSVFASNKRYILSFLLFFLFLCFSLSAEARFGGGESHQASYKSDDSSGVYSYIYYCKHNPKDRRCRKSNFHKLESKYVVMLLVLVGGGIGLPFLYLWLISSRKPPKDINKLAFTRFLRERFMLLQTLWDQDDWEKISKYIDRTLLDSFQDARVRTRARDMETTTIRNLSTYIKGFKTTPDQCDVKVEFSGLDNEIYFKELWTFRRLGGDWAPWLVVGIVTLK